MDRRGFIKGLALASGGLFVDGETIESLEGVAFRSGVPILQGFTDETTAQFTVDLPRDLSVHYEVLDPKSGKVIEPILVSEGRREYSGFRVDKVLFKDLYLNDGFELFVLDERRRIIDHREFKTLDTNKKTARIALLSCMLDLNTAHYEMWRLVGSKDPDLLFMLGDNVYGDFYGIFHGPELLWMRYIQTRRALGLYRRKRLIPSIAIWDDHDFGKNNVSGGYKHREHSLETFNNFYAQVPIGPSHSSGPGVASSFTAFRQKFIFLDGRYWRNMKSRQWGVGFLGEEQMQWLERELRHEQEQTWIFQGSQFFGDHKVECGTYQKQAPYELEALGRQVRAHDKATYFVSGDVHFSEVSEVPREFLGYKAVEFTSSCLHSLVTVKPPKNNRRKMGATYENFLLLEILGSHNFRVDCYGRYGRHHFNYRA